MTALLSGPAAAPDGAPDEPAEPADMRRPLLLQAASRCAAFAQVPAGVVG
jgi:hypothetical protein